LFIREFDKLIEESSSLKSSIPTKEAIRFWRKYWYLQQEQFEYWKIGLVDHKYYENWMKYRNTEWKHDCVFGVPGYQSGYQQIRNNLVPEFSEFMESIFAGTPLTIRRTKQIQLR